MGRIRKIDLMIHLPKSHLYYQVYLNFLITHQLLKIYHLLLGVGIANEFNLFASGKNIIKRKNAIKNGKIRTLPNFNAVMIIII